MGTMQVEPEHIPSYGILDVKSEDGRTIKARGLIEKPSIADAPSNNAVIGRYLLSPKIMHRLVETNPGFGGEIQLTDAINAEASSPEGVYGYRFDAQRYDCGSMAGFLKATIDFGLDRPELHAELMDYMRKVVDTSK